MPYFLPRWAVCPVPGLVGVPQEEAAPAVPVALMRKPVGGLEKPVALTVVPVARPFFVPARRGGVADGVPIRATLSVFLLWQVVCLTKGETINN